MDARLADLVARLPRDAIEKLLISSVENGQPVSLDEIKQNLPAAKREAKIAKHAVSLTTRLRGEVGHFQQLSLELHLKMFAGLHVQTVLNILCTCSGWRSLAQEPGLWRYVPAPGAASLREVLCRYLRLEQYDSESRFRSNPLPLPKHALRFIVPFLVNIGMNSHVHELSLSGDWEHVNQIKVLIKSFVDVHKVSLSGKKITDAVLDTAAKHWNRLRSVAFLNTKSDLNSKLKLISANHGITEVRLDTRLGAQVLNQLASASLRNGGTSIIQRLSTATNSYDAPTLTESCPVWKSIGAELPELTFLSLAFKIEHDELPLEPSELFPVISRLETLELTISPRNRWAGSSNQGPTFKAPPDPTPHIECFLAKLLPACPRLVTFQLTYRRDGVSKKDAKAGIKPTPDPTPPSTFCVKQWAPNLQRSVITGSWAN